MISTNKSGESEIDVNQCELGVNHDTRSQIIRRIIILLILVIGVSLPGVASATSVSVVTLAENANPNDGITYLDGGTASEPLTVFAKILPAFLNPGYTFSHWTVNQDGTGTQYADGAVYDFSQGNIVLWAQWVPNHVTFYENGSSTDSVNAVENSSTSTPLTLFSDLSPSFSKAGYVFNGWSTSASGTGSTYSNGATYDFTLGSMSLYAQWSPATYAIVYSADGGTASATSSSFTTGGSSITLPTASQPGYTFDGWFTAAQGGTLVGMGGASFTPTASATLYAQWTANAFSINYAADGGTASSTSASFVAGSGSMALPTATEPGYNFDGWYTAAQGGTLVGMGGASFTPTSSMTLYAKWTAATSVVTYVGNGGVVSPATSSYTTGSSPMTLPTPTQSGFTFDGWFTAPQGGSFVGMGGNSYAPASSMTLFAQWTTIPTFNVTFSANGGTGSVSSVSALSGAMVSLPSPDSMSRPGYAFVNWNSLADGSGVTFGPNSSFTLTSPMTLYAQWHQLPAATLSFALNGAHGTVAAISAYAGASEILPAPPALARPGYVFTGWNTHADGTGSMFASGVTMTLSTSLTLYAQWSGHAPAQLERPIGPFVSARVAITGALTAQVHQLAALVIRQRRSVVTLYGYTSNASTFQAGQSEGRARAAAVAGALRRALTLMHHGGVRIVVVNEGPAAGASNRVSVVVR